MPKSGRPRRLLAAGLGAAVCLSPSAIPAHAAGAGPGAGGVGAQLDPPPLRVLTRGAGMGSGDIFIAPAGGHYAAGPEILTKTGRVVWFHRLLSGDVAADFRTQTYHGHPVLTWMQSQSGGFAAQDGPGGKELVTPNGIGYVYDDRYRQIASIQAGNGYAVNFHELLIRHDTAWILADKTTTANLTSIGGRRNQRVIDTVVQQIDIKTGRVLYQWNAAKHIAYRESYQGFPSSAKKPWDWLHLNAVHFDRDGNLLVSSRNTWTVFKVDRRSGQIVWRLGGRRSSFALRAAAGQTLDHAGKIFAWQHDPEALGGDNYTVFDDESGGRQLRCSRAVTVHLDLVHRTATLLSSDDQPEGKVARAMGNAQPTAAHDMFVGWGSLPYISEFSATGKLVFNAELPSGVVTYRAYLLPWHG